MLLDDLIKQVLLLSPNDKEKIYLILSQEREHVFDNHSFPGRLANLPEWKEMDNRAKEVVREEKTCLVHFDDHMKSITA